MSFEVHTIKPFERQLKQLAKKYPSLRSDYAALIVSLANDPDQGAPLGSGCYKVRMSIASKGRGKSGGTRVITHLAIREKKVWLLSIYDKSEVDNVPGEQVKALLELIPR